MSDSPRNGKMPHFGVESPSDLITLWVTCSPTPLAVNAPSQGGPHDEIMETVLGSGPGGGRSAGGAGHWANHRHRQKQRRSADRVCHCDGARDEALRSERSGRPVHIGGGATRVVHGGRS